MGNTGGRNFMAPESWTQLRARAHSLSMLDVLNASKTQDSISTGAMDRLPSIPIDATIQSLVAGLSATPNGAVLVTDRNGEVIDSIDMFRIVRYLLFLYEGSAMAQNSFGGDTTSAGIPMSQVARAVPDQSNYNFWQGYDRWMESRAAAAGLPAPPPASDSATMQPLSSSSSMASPSSRGDAYAQTQQPGDAYSHTQRPATYSSAQMPPSTTTTTTYTSMASQAATSGVAQPTITCTTTVDPVSGAATSVAHPNTLSASRAETIDTTATSLSAMQSQSQPPMQPMQQAMQQPLQQYMAAATAQPMAAAQPASVTPLTSIRVPPPASLTVNTAATTRAAQSFFNLTVREVLAERSLDRYSRTMHPSMAIPETTRLSDALHFFAEGYSNVLLKTYDGRFRFVSQTDLLTALTLDEQRLPGAVKFRKLGISRRVLYSVRQNDFTLQAFRLMSDRGMAAVPITDEQGWLSGEVAISSLRGLRPDNFHTLFGHVWQFNEAMGHGEAPLVLKKDANMSSLLAMMSGDPSKRSHVWITSRKTQRVKSTVSLPDIFRGIMYKLQSE